MKLVWKTVSGQEQPLLMWITFSLTSLMFNVGITWSIFLFQAAKWASGQTFASIHKILSKARFIALSLVKGSGAAKSFVPIQKSLSQELKAKEGERETGQSNSQQEASARAGEVGYFTLFAFCRLQSLTWITEQIRYRPCFRIFCFIKRSFFF